jgi:rare lipoprotein A
LNDRFGIGQQLARITAQADYRGICMTEPPRLPGRQINMLGMAAAVFLLAACSSGPDMTTGAKRQAGQPYSVNGATYAPREEPGYDTVGIASWYGKRYHGRRTASGEIFDMNSATAAHRTLPFGTRVQVTNLENGRSAVLKINDRGPFVRRRIIDVSRHAAQALGFVQQGTVRVRVRLVQPAPG